MHIFNWRIVGRRSSLNAFNNFVLPGILDDSMNVKSDNGYAKCCVNIRQSISNVWRLQYKEGKGFKY